MRALSKKNKKRENDEQEKIESGGRKIRGRENKKEEVGVFCVLGPGNLDWDVRGARLHQEEAAAVKEGEEEGVLIIPQSFLSLGHNNPSLHLGAVFVAAASFPQRTSHTGPWPR